MKNYFFLLLTLLFFSEIVFGQIVPGEGKYGIYTETAANTTAGSAALDVDAAIYPWSGTLDVVADAVAYEGTEVIAYQQAEGTTWFGMGIAALGEPYNFSAYSIEGYLHFELKTTTTTTFDIRIESSTGTGSVTFANGADPYGFVRDGNYHAIDIPLADFVSQGVDLKSITQLFIFAGAATGLGEVCIDNIYYGGGLSFDDPRLDGKLTTIDVKTDFPTILTGNEIGLWATGYNQYGAEMDISSFNWSSDGGTVNQLAQFSASSQGLYTISASATDKYGQVITGTKSVAVYNTLPLSSQLPADGNFAIFAEEPANNTAGKLALGTDGNIFVWENTLLATPTSASEGTDVLSFTSGGKGWLGLGITLTSPMNISAYTCSDGVLHFDLKTDQTNDFDIRIGNDDAIATITFANGSDPYGFVRDGNWHGIDIPIADFVVLGLDVTNITQIFQFVCGSDISGEIAFDNIYLKNGHAWSDPCLAAELSTVEITAPKYKILTNQSVQLSATALSQYSVEYPNAEITWAVNNGGSITQDGLFTASANQTYTVTATTQNESGADVIGSVDIIMTDNIPVSTEGRFVYVNGERYIIKGICYGPTPIGSTQRSWETLTQDIALMKEAGINTIRTYDPIEEAWVLDELAANGIKVIMGFTNGSGGYDIASGTYLDYINMFKNHDAILFWDLGNEYNYHPEWFGGNMDNWYNAMNKAAAAIHAIDYDHPVSTAHGELPADDVLAKCPNIDVWGMNVYRWDQSHTAITDFAAKSNLPCYLSETGADSYNTNPEHDLYAFGENQQMQADANEVILQGVFNNLDVGSGLTLFGFTDGWWKAGNPDTQDPGGWAPNSSGVPYDGTPNEEYWGIVDIFRNKKITYDIVKSYYTGSVCLISAKAGDDQSLPGGTTSATLDGSESSDPEGGSLSFAWTQTAGSSATIVNANSVTTNVNGLTEGDYTFLLTVTGSCGVRTDEVKISVDSLANAAPVANAGSNQTITLPVNSVSLSGSGTDPDGDALTFTWSQVSGPSSASFSNQNTAQTNVSGLVEGDYVMQLKVSDGDLSDSATVQIKVEPEIVTGIAIPGIMEAEEYTEMFGIQTEPTGDVGGGLNIGWTDPGDWMDFEVTVASAGAYDAAFRVASPGGGAQLQLLSGNTVLTTIDITATSGWQNWTTINASVNLDAGNQTLRLYCVTGGFNVNYVDFDDDIVVNNPPTADAGDNKIITLPVNSVNLEGSGSDIDGDALSYNWTQLSGPNAAVFSNNADAQPVISELVAGTYLMQLIVSDGALSDTAEVAVIVYPGGNENIALNKPVTASSIENNTMLADNVNDGDLNTRWSSLFEDPQWIEIDLQGYYDISEVVLVWEAAASQAYQIEVSNDGVNWTSVYSTDTGNGGTDQIALNTSGSYIRLLSTARTTPYGNSLWEMEVYGTVGDIITGTEIPAVIQSEDYVDMSGIQTEATADIGGGLNVGWTAPGDWLDYDIYVPVSGTYSVDFRVASPNGGAQLQLLSGSSVLTTIDITATGGWQNWTTITSQVDLNAGNQTIRLYCVTGGFNINYMEFYSGQSSLKASQNSDNFENRISNPTISVYPNPATTHLKVRTNGEVFNSLSIYSISGKRVYSANISEEQSEIPVNVSNLKNGIYFIEVRNAESVNRLKFIKK